MTVTATRFEASLASAVELLRGLPRRRDAAGEATEAVRSWSQAHPAAHAELVVAPRPASPIVDYDLLLDHPDGGTVTVTVQAEDGVPWLVDHSTHWAANLILSVGDDHVTVPEALFALRSAGTRRPSLHQELVDHCLIQAEIRSDTRPVTAAELQATADEFRRARGLHDRAATLAWLAAMKLSERDFAGHLEQLARSRRFRLGKEAELAPGYLTAHRGDFELVHAAWIRTSDTALAERLAGAFTTMASLPNLLGTDAELTVADRVAGELPEALRGAAVDMVVGPVPDAGALLVGAVLRRWPAEDTAETLAAAGRAAFAGWLAERRAEADITWHWL